MKATALFAPLLFLNFKNVYSKRPNIVFVLTDNQDVSLGGLIPMRKTKHLIAEEGVTFTNAFVTTPVCCPSRSTILTGLYPHNSGVVTNREPGNCNGQDWRDGAEKAAYAVHLSERGGYETAFIGKYLNRYGLQEAGGLEHVPPGWTHWRALVGNSVYFNYTLSIDGRAESHGFDLEKDYFTNMVKNKALEFINEERDREKPFFLCLSTSAPHDPETPEPKYESEFADLSAPRTPQFNVDPHSTKHWLTRMDPRTMDDSTVAYVDDKFRNRWRSLLSVDDMIESVVEALEAQGEWEDTYLVFASDHGYHLGQFGMPYDMRQPYEFDIRIPLLLKGPGVGKNRTISSRAVLSIDFAPTFLEMAGILDRETSAFFDGSSFLAPPISSKRAFLIEYRGEGNYLRIDRACSRWYTGRFYTCYEEFGCRCIDTTNNTYTCLRKFDGDGNENSIYCQFSDSEAFEEYYDLAVDPHQLRNLAPVMDPDNRRNLREEMRHLSACRGNECRLENNNNLNLHFYALVVLAVLTICSSSLFLFMLLCRFELSVKRNPYKLLEEE